MHLSKKPYGTITIHEDGQDKVCPFIPPVAHMPAPGSLSKSATLQFQPCNNRCVHFRIEPLRENFKVKLSCGTGGEIEMEMKEETSLTPKQKIHHE
jgi:hypothetical protein